jgi:acyl carrier protein
LGQIHGVIHTAGVIGGGVMQLKTAETIASVLRPKAKGMLVLDALLGHKECDFLLAFSSISAILGEFGQSDYCAANIFLDTFARQKTAEHDPFTVSVNWDTWKEVGMTVDTVKTAKMPPEITEKLKQEIAAGITSEEGANVFARILSQQTLSQVIVSTKDLQRQIRDVKTFTLSHILKVLDEDGATKPAHPRPNLQNDYVAPDGEVEEKIAAVWQRVLGVEKVGVQDNFFDLGGHSLLATRIVSRLSNTFGLNLSLEQFFEATCIAELAVQIAELQAVQESQDKLEVLEMLAELSDEDAEIALRESSLDSSD